MSQENVEIVRQGFIAFEQGDLTQLLDLLSDDVVTYRAVPDGVTYRGKSGFLEAAAEWTEGFSEWSPIPQEFIEAGNRVLVRVCQIARGESSGVRVEGEFWWLYELMGGKVSKVSFYDSREAAMEAVRLPE